MHTKTYPAPALSVVRLELVPDESWESKPAYCVIRYPVSVVLQCLLMSGCGTG